MKILILALSGIGDALMFTPALKLLRKELPEAEIDALVMYDGSYKMYLRNPNLNKVIFFDFLKEGLASSLRFVMKLRGKYDISINVYPANRKEYNIINFLIGAKKRAGIQYLRKNAANLGFLNNVKVNENDSIHNVQENLKLCEELLNKKFDEEPPLEFVLEKDDIAFAGNYLNNLNINSKDLVIGFHPGCSPLKNHTKRRWEPEKFAALGSKLIRDRNAKILIFGGPDEDDLKENIKNQINNENVFSIHADNLPHSAAIMKRCNIFVTNDSSLMHIAAALKLKIVAILGPTNQNYIHPWKTEHQIVRLDLDCSPCFIYSPRPLICFRKDVKFKCIKELDVDLVFNAVKKFLVN